MQDDDDLVSTAEALRIDAGTKFCRQRDDSYDKKNRFVQAAYKIIEKGESNGRESFLICISVEKDDSHGRLPYYLKPKFYVRVVPMY